MPISVVLLKFGKRIRDFIWSGFARPNRADFAVCGREGAAAKIEMKNWTEIANKLIVIKNQSEIYGGDGER